MTAAVLRGRKRRGSALSRYEICCICCALRDTACDQKAVGTGGDGINAVALQQPVQRREFEVTRAMSILYCIAQYRRRNPLERSYPDRTN